MESQTRLSKRAPREFQNWRVQGNLLTLRNPFANLSPTFRQPFVNLFCQALSFSPWAPGTRSEARVNGFLGLGGASVNVSNILRHVPTKGYPQNPDTCLEL